MEVEAGFAEVNGTRLYHESRGSGPALLFLHGFTLDHRMWRPQVDAFAQAGFRAVAYDQRGFGRSALPGPETYRPCDDAAALVEHLRLGPVLAVGHSIGALYALELALSRPAMVAGLASICMSGLGGIPFSDDHRAMFGAVRAVAGRPGGMTEAKRIWSAGGWFAPAREAPEVRAEIDVLIGDYSGWHWTHDNPVANIDPPAHTRLAELAVPALVVDGERDLDHNHAVAQALARELPRVELARVPGASHMANLDRPAIINAALERFARRCFGLG